MSAENMLLLFQRPLEPAFVPKGEKQQAFDIPMELLSEKHQKIGVELNNRFRDETREKIKVKKISTPSIQDIVEGVPRQDVFSFFIPKHRRLCGKLINIFLNMRSLEDLQAMAIYARERVNPLLFNYCFSVALLHRPDTQNLQIPPLIENFPDKYLDSRAFRKAREEVSVVPPDQRVPIVIPKDYTASDLETEHKLAYFREDIGINLHHWHWHLVYPFEGARSVVDKDRRGELFYYMHQQIVARYNLERFCNGLGKVERLNKFDEQIKEAYFPKLDNLTASRAWPARVANQKIRDLRRDQDQIKLDVQDLTRWDKRVMDAIQSGFALNTRNEMLRLDDEFTGIDVLGNMVESSILSPNRDFYGDLHNMGHVFISYIHDPDHRHLESFGVMGDSTTAMRDPVFYRWHAYIDHIFQQQKGRLPAYPEAQLNYPNVQVTGATIDSEGARNILRTFWQRSDVDLSRGLDFQPRGSVFARFTHLNHRPFSYTITYNNTSGGARMGTCRIFLGPRNDEKGNPWVFREHRQFFIELDRFQVPLRQGENKFTRHSTESNVTIPFERTFRDVDTNRPEGGDALAQFNFCGCGWPQHMLIPKGTPEGYPCYLFVMISNYDDDRVDNNGTPGMCDDAMSYCGVKDRKYPDRRSMGYPFDRLPRARVNTLQDFLTPNMIAVECQVQFTNKTYLRNGQEVANA